MDVATIHGSLLPATQIIHATVADSRGEKLGRVEDLIVRLADGGYPPVTGLKVRIGGRELFVPASQIRSLEPGRVQLSGDTLSLQRFERRPGEVLLHEDVLDRRLIDVSAGRLVHANDVELASIDGWWRLVGVDPRRRGVLSRLRPARPHATEPSEVLDWTDIEPFVGHVPTARLNFPLRRLKRLHAAQIADIVEGASHDEGQEILDAVEADPELEADVFEELDTHHQLEFLQSKTDAEAAEILGEMDPDDAADLINELDQERRAPILALLPDEQRRKVQGLLAYNPETAGGMMSPDFTAVSDKATVREALERVRAVPDDVPWQASSEIFLVDDTGKLQGSLSVVELLRANTDVPLGAVVEEPVAARLSVDDDLATVALTMADFNMTAAPVVDHDGRVVGVVTADDLVDALIPKDWRRRQIADSDD
jgi:CBS domain-containing protein/sporulation protein YlmC with PRC-barrel domain